MEFKSAPEISCESGCRKMLWQRLELYAGKLARTVLRGLGAGNRAWLPSDVGSSHERHDGFTQGREFDCSNYRATWNAPVGWRAQYRALTNLRQPIAPSQRQGSLRSGFACP